MKKIYFSLVAIAILATSACTSGTAKKNEKALSLDELIEKHPDSIPLLLKRGNERFKNYEYEKAMEDAARAFRLDSNQFDVRLLYANVLNNRTERSIEQVSIAQRHFRKLLTAQPRHTEVLIGLASTYSQFQDFENSFKYINEALRIDPKYRDAYVLKGSNYAVLGKPDLMKSSYETAVQQDPNFFAGYLVLGSIYENENSPLCIEYYTTAYQLEPENREAKYAMAYAMQHFGKLESAKEIYRNMAKDTAEYYASQALFQLGHIKQMVNGDLDSAMYFYEGATFVKPDFVEAYHNLGVCYDLKGNKPKALKSFSKALKHNPSYKLSRDYADSLGRIMGL